MGPYPFKTSEIDEMKRKGITAVLNLQTQEEMNLMGIDWPAQLQTYRQYGIETVVHHPCSNLSQDYSNKTFEASQQLFSLVNKRNMTVFIHCSSGLVRAPTTVLAYLCVFKRIKNWRNVLLSRDFVVENAHNSIPNTNVVEQILSDNRAFHEKQIDVEREKDHKRREMIRKYDQKQKILRELEIERKNRQTKLDERDRLNKQRKNDWQRNEERLEKDSKAKMEVYTT